MAEMKVVEITPGVRGPEALVIATRARPEPGPGEVRIKVAAAGVNRPDVLQRMGLYPPPEGASDIPGLEVSGVVDALGEGADAAWLGARVCALLAGGGYGQWVTVDQRHLMPVPDHMALSDAAALPETVITVHANVFEAGGLKGGETLLVHGATSGIGVTAIALAKAAGARVVATSRGADKAEAARALGADVAIDASAGPWQAGAEAAGGADVILDMVGAGYARANLAVLKPGGRWVVIAFQSGALAEVDLMTLMRKQAVLTGSTLRARSDDEKARLIAQVRQRHWPLIDSGAARIPVSARFALDKAVDAHRLMEAGVHTGKIILDLEA
ncbi:MAG: NAD(P)H-quinone oxidoreductase [Brevundimonas sp.]|uniref:NAD(P)H-quinone oxidoreductase n=1 Tax=Brevundimonas sp. TaxID=1871086 RepID=UPI00391BF454